MSEAVQHEPSTDVVVTTVSGQVTPTHYSDSPEYDHLVLALLRQSADAGSAESQSKLGAMYACGDGVPKDYHLALEYLRKAADKGDALALYNLGVMHAKGYGVTVDPELAVKCYTRGAERGSLDASVDTQLEEIERGLADRLRRQG